MARWRVSDNHSLVQRGISGGERKAFEAELLGLFIRDAAPSAHGQTQTRATAVFRRPVAYARPFASTRTYFRDESPGGRMSGDSRTGFSGWEYSGGGVCSAGAGGALASVGKLIVKAFDSKALAEYGHLP